MNAPNVRSATVRLNAEVAKYIADIKAAGAATDQAFSRAHTSVGRFDDDLQSTTKSSDALAKQTRTTARETDALGSSVSKTTKQVKDYSLAQAIADERTSRLRSSMREQAKAAVDAEHGIVLTRNEIDRLSDSAARGSNDIDRYGGRLALLGKFVAALGPSLVPIGAVAIPALTGLSNQFGFAAVAAGTAVLAFQGVGDALSAVNKASIQPTAANIAKAHLAMQQISPVARDLVKELSSLKPVFEGLRDTGAEGLFPGVIEGMESLERLAPKVERIIREVSFTLSDLISEGADSLASDRWTEFFGFIAREARPVLTDMAHAIGSVTHGLAEMWMAFQPLNRSFGSWLADSAAAFDRWAANLAQTDGFQEFVDYIRTNGPKVADAFSAIGDALVQITEAAAPLGGPVLDAIAAIAQAIATIADSPLGTPLVAAVTTMSALSLAASAGTASLARLSAAMVALGLSSPKAAAGVAATGAAATTAAVEANVATASVTRMNAALVETGAAGATAGSGLAELAGGPAGIAAFIGLSNLNDGLTNLKMTLSGDRNPIEGLARMAAGFSPVGEAAELFGVDVFGANQEVGTLTKGMIALHWATQDTTETVIHAGRAVDKFSGPLFRAGRDLLKNERHIAALRKQIQASNEAIRQSASEWGDYSQKVKAADTGIEAVIRRMGKLAEAASNEAANIQTLLKDGFDPKAIQNLIDTLGPQGAALAIDQLANGGKKLRESFLHAFDGLQGAEGKVRGAFRAVDEGVTGTRARLRELEDEHVDLKATLDTGQLMNQANRADTTLNNLGEQHPKPKADLDPTDLFNQAGRARATLDDLGRQHPKPKVTIDGNALETANSIRSAITNIPRTWSSTITVRTVRVGNDTAGGPAPLGPGGADGMTVPGQRIPYGDKVYIHAAPGEEIISNRHGQADRFRADRAAGRIPSYASGGTVGAGPSPIYTRGADNEVERWSRETSLALKQLAGTAEAGGATFDGVFESASKTGATFDGVMDHATKSAERELKARERMLEQEIDANRERLSALREERDAIKDSVEQLIQGSADLWDSVREAVIPAIGSSDAITWEDSAATFESASDQLQFQFQNASELADLIKKLRRKGFDGPALAALLQSASIETIRDFANQSRDELAAFEQQFEDTQSLTGQVGNQAAGAVGITKELRQLVAQNHDLHQELRELNRKQQHAAKQRDDQTKATKHVGEDTARAMNRSANRAMTGARRSGR